MTIVYYPRRAVVQALLLVLVCAFPSARAADRVALVVGNSDYPFEPLQNPVNDARAMARTLRELGFEVIERENADQRTMERSLALFRGKLGPDTLGLFYFSGHGVQYGGENWLIPTDVDTLSAGSVKYKSVAAGYVLAEMESAANHTNIVILDACRNNPFRVGSKGIHRGLARMDSFNGSLVAYATAPGDVAADGNGRNSPYTKYLVQYMDDPGLPIEQVFKKVRMAVHRETGGAQVPWESSSLVDEVYLAGTEKAESKPALTSTPIPGPAVRPTPSVVASARQPAPDVVIPPRHPAPKIVIPPRYSSPNIVIPPRQSSPPPSATRPGDRRYCTLHVGAATYRGQCVNGVAQGNGVMTYPDGQVYKGWFRNGLRDGYGTHTFPDGFAMSGLWRQGSLLSSRSH